MPVYLFQYLQFITVTFFKYWVITVRTSGTTRHRKGFMKTSGAAMNDPAFSTGKFDRRDFDKLTMDEKMDAEQRVIRHH
jgi:hypothetical protein